MNNHKQPRIRKLSGPHIYCWTWDEGHHREHHFCCLPKLTIVDLDWEGWSTSHFHLQQTRWFQIPQTFRSWVVISHHRRPIPFLFLSQFIRYAWACSSYEYCLLRSRRLSSKLFRQELYLVNCTLEIVIHEVLYEVSLSRKLNYILTLDHLQWLPNWSNFSPILWPWYRAWPSSN